MSIRFNRNDANVPDDRLFTADYQVDQNSQDSEMRQKIVDFGCVPCIGSGLTVTSKSEPDHKVEVAIGYAYDKDGYRVTIESAQEVVLTNTAGGNNYILLKYKSVTSDNRPAHYTGVSYPTRITDSFEFTVQATAPAVDDIVLANCKQTGTGTITIDVTERLVRTCKLIPMSSVPAVAEEEGTGTGAEPPPPGQQHELPDLPKGRTVPMPIILSGTRSGEAWVGIETVMPEELGRTTAALAAITLERVNLKSGTPLADVKVWIGDWGTGQRDGSNLKKCNFTMPTKSGVSAWNTDLWITDPPGYYYLVKHDESWYSKITDSGSSWVICEDDLPDAVAAEYYVCAYAEKYESQSTPYETDSVVAVTHANTYRQAIRIASPVTPMAVIKSLNLGGKYRLKVASLVSGDNYTKWAEADFIVGSDLVVCWEPASANLNVVAVDGGVEITIPAPDIGSTEPEAYEVVYTYGDSPAEPDFDNTEHPTIRPKDRVFKLDVPPGQKVKVKCRAVKTRMAMKCSGTVKVLTPSDTYVVAGGVANVRNRKQMMNPIKETSLASAGYKLVDAQKLPNAVWPESIFIFNPTDSAQADFEVYIHGSNQAYTAGRKITIAVGGDFTQVGARGTVEKAIADFKITDPALAVTIKNTAVGAQTLDLRYTVQYREDAESKIS